MIQEAADRIRKMEQTFDVLQEVVSRNPTTISQDPLLKKGIRKLTQYYESGQWLQDYELDEKGLLPPDLKRGVLSQDAVYNFLDRITDLKSYLQNSEVHNAQVSID